MGVLPEELVVRYEATIFRHCARQLPLKVWARPGGVLFDRIALPLLVESADRDVWLFQELICLAGELDPHLPPALRRWLKKLDQEALLAREKWGGDFVLAEMGHGCMWAALPFWIEQSEKDAWAFNDLQKLVYKFRATEFPAEYWPLEFRDFVTEVAAGIRKEPTIHVNSPSAIEYGGPTMRRFDPDRHYRPQDEEMRLIARVTTLKQWRHEKRGPRYTKSGSRVLYLGRDLNAYLDARLVETDTQPTT